MGYNTIFELKVEIDGKSNEASEEIISQLRKECECAEYALDDCGTPPESCKWYEWKQDLLEFSKKNPDAIFHLSGTGEENGDMWRASFLNGKVHARYAQISFEDFDPNKLV